MNWFLGIVIGYLIHDAVQPTVVGDLLDPLSLPKDLFVDEEE